MVGSTLYCGEIKNKKSKNVQLEWKIWSILSISARLGGERVQLRQMYWNIKKKVGPIDVDLSAWPQLGIPMHPLELKILPPQSCSDTRCSNFWLNWKLLDFLALITSTIEWGLSTITVSDLAICDGYFFRQEPHLYHQYHYNGPSKILISEGRFCVNWSTKA